MRSLSSQTVSRLQRALAWLVVLEVAIAFSALVSNSTQLYKMLHDIHLPRGPSKLAYSIAASVLTFIVGSFLIGAHIAKPIWWRPFSRLGLQIMMSTALILFVVWISTTGASWYDCTDLCATYGPSYRAFIMYTSSLCCSCLAGSYTPVTCNAGRHGFTNPLGSDNNVGGAYHASQAFAILDMLFFLASTLIWILLLIQYSPPGGNGEYLSPAQGQGYGQSYQANTNGHAYPVTPGGYGGSESPGGAYEPYKTYPIPSNRSPSPYQDPEPSASYTAVDGKLAVPTSYV